MVAVENALSTSFWAVPAFIRVEPASTSGPVSTQMWTSATDGRLGGRVGARPARCGRRSVGPRPSAPATYGVRPLAVSPTATSPAVSASASAAPESPVVLDVLERGVERLGARRRGGRRPGRAPARTSAAARRRPWRRSGRRCRRRSSARSRPRPARRPPGRPPPRSPAAPPRRPAATWASSSLIRRSRSSVGSRSRSSDRGWRRSVGASTGVGWRVAVTGRPSGRRAGRARRRG